MTEMLHIFAAIILVGTASRGETTERFRVDMSNAAISATEAESSDYFPDADALIHASLGGEHQSHDDIRRLAKNLERSFGMESGDVLESFLEIAESPDEPKETRTAAIFAFCSLSGGAENGKLDRLFRDGDNWIRETSLAAAMGALPTVSSQLAFLDERLLDWRTNIRFQNDALVLIARFHQILKYKFGTEDEREEVLAYFREHARAPSSAALAFGCESILARFDPQWPTSLDRRKLLQCWKDDSSLTEFARKQMNEAWRSCLPDSDESEGAVSSSVKNLPEPGPPSTCIGSGDSASLGDSRQSADSGMNAANSAVWILGTAAVLVVALFVRLRRNRHR